MSETLTISQFKSLPKKKRSKYGNRKSGKFDSEKERNRYATLKLMERAGEIRNVQHHKVYSLDVNGVHICNYESDFSYEQYAPDKDVEHYEHSEVTGIAEKGYWYRIVEDVKGFRNTSDPYYRLYEAKKRLMQAIYNITIVEV